MGFIQELRDSFNLRGAPKLPEVEEPEEEPEDSDFRLTNPYRFQREGFIAFAIHRQKLYRLKYDAVENDADSHVETDGRTQGRMEAIVYASNLSKPEEIVETYHFNTNDDDKVVADFGIVAVGKYLYLIAKYSTASLAPNYGNTPVHVWQMNTFNHRVREVITGSNTSTVRLQFEGMVVDGDDVYLVMNEADSWTFTNVGGWHTVLTGDVYSLDQESLEYTKLTSEGDGEIRMIYEARSTSPRERRMAWHGVWYVDEDGYAWNTMVIDNNPATPSSREMLWVGLAAWQWNNLQDFIDNGTANPQYINLVTDKNSRPERELGALIGLDYTPDGDEWDWDTDNFVRNMGFNMDALGIPRVSFLRNIRLDMSPGAEGKFTHLFRTGIDGLIEGDDIPVGYRSPSWKTDYAPVGYEWVGSNIENTNDFDDGELRFVNLFRGVTPGSEPTRNWRWSAAVEDASVADFIPLERSGYLYFVGLDTGTTDVTVSVNDSVQITELVTFRLTWDLEELDDSDVLFFQGSSQTSISEVNILATDILDEEEIFTDVEDRIYMGSSTGIDRRQIFLQMSEGDDILTVEEGVQIPATITVGEKEYTLERLHFELDGSLLNHRGKEDRTGVLKAILPGEALVSGEVFQATANELDINVILDVMSLNPHWLPYPPDWQKRGSDVGHWEAKRDIIVGKTLELNLAGSVIVNDINDVTFSIQNEDLYTTYESVVGVSPSIDGTILTIEGLREVDQDYRIIVEATDGIATEVVGSFWVRCEEHEPVTLGSNLWRPGDGWTTVTSRHWSTDLTIGSDYGKSVNLTGSYVEGNAPVVFLLEYDSESPHLRASVVILTSSPTRMYFIGDTIGETDVTLKVRDECMEDSEALTIGTFTLDVDDVYIKLNRNADWTPGTGWGFVDTIRDEWHPVLGNTVRVWHKDVTLYRDDVADMHNDNATEVDVSDWVIEDVDADVRYRIFKRVAVEATIDSATDTLSITPQHGGRIELRIEARDTTPNPDRHITVTKLLLDVTDEYVAFERNPDYDPGEPWAEQSAGDLSGLETVVENVPIFGYTNTIGDAPVLTLLSNSIRGVDGRSYSDTPTFYIKRKSQGLDATIQAGFGVWLRTDSNIETEGYVDVWARDGTTDIAVAYFRPRYEDEYEDLTLDYTWSPTGWTVGYPDQPALPGITPRERTWHTIGIVNNPFTLDLSESYTADEDAFIRYHLEPTSDFDDMATASISGDTLTIIPSAHGAGAVHVYVDDPLDTVSRRRLGTFFVTVESTITMEFELDSTWNPPGWTSTGTNSDGVRTWSYNTNFRPGSFQIDFEDSVVSTTTIGSITAHVDPTYETSIDETHVDVTSWFGEELFAGWGNVVTPRADGTAVITLTAEREIVESGAIVNRVLTIGIFTVNFTPAYIPIEAATAWSPSGDEWQYVSTRLWSAIPFVFDDEDDNIITVDFTDSVLEHKANKDWVFAVTSSVSDIASAEIDQDTQMLTIKGLKTGSTIVTVRATDEAAGGTANVVIASFSLTVKIRFRNLALDPDWSPTGWTRVGAAADRVWEKTIRYTRGTGLVALTRNTVLDLYDSVIEGTEDFLYRATYGRGTSGWDHFDFELRDTLFSSPYSLSTSGDYLYITATNPGRGSIEIYAIQDQPDADTVPSGTTVAGSLHVGTFIVNVEQQYRKFAINPTWSPVATSHPTLRFRRSSTDSRTWGISGTSSNRIRLGHSGRVVVPIEHLVIPHDSNVAYEHRLLTANAATVTTQEVLGLNLEPSWSTSIEGRIGTTVTVEIYAFDINRKTETRQKVATLRVTFSTPGVTDVYFTPTFYEGSTAVTSVNVEVTSQSTTELSYSGTISLPNVTYTIPNAPVPIRSHSSQITSSNAHFGGATSSVTPRTGTFTSLRYRTLNSFEFEQYFFRSGTARTVPVNLTIEGWQHTTATHRYIQRAATLRVNVRIVPLERLPTTIRFYNGNPPYNRIYSVGTIEYDRHLGREVFPSVGPRFTQPYVGYPGGGFRSITWTSSENVTISSVTGSNFSHPLTGDYMNLLSISLGSIPDDEPLGVQWQTLTYTVAANNTYEAASGTLRVAFRIVDSG